MTTLPVYPTQAVQGSRLHTAGMMTFDLNVPELIDHEVDPRIHKLESTMGSTPILGISSRLGGPERVAGPVFRMFEIRPRKNYFVLTSTFLVGASTIPVAAGDVANILEGYYVVNLHTREMMRINGTPATSMPVARAQGSIAAAANATATDEFMILHAFAAEGDTPFTDLTRQPTMRYNYVGEHNVKVGITQYQAAVKMVGEGNAWGYIRMDAIEQLSMVLERSTIFAQRAKTYINNKAVYIPNGLDALSTENEYDFAHAVTEAKVLAALEAAFRYGPKTRTVFLSPQSLRAINVALALQTNGRRVDTEVMRKAGIAIFQYESPYGLVNFVMHPLFYDAASTDALSLAYTTFLVAFGSERNAQGLKYKTLGGELGGWFRWFPNVHTPGLRGKQDMLVVNWSLSLPFAECLARWVDVKP